MPAATSARPRAPRPVARLAAALLAAGLLAAPALAAPEATAGDAIARFLVERGDTGLADQVRERAAEMVLTAMNFLGVPYRRGGQSEDQGFDCSGFTRHVFERALGLVLPRRVDEQAHAAGFEPVRRSELQPGDLVFFNTLRRSFSHVGIYVGDGKFIHSPRSGAAVRVEDMTLAYWAKRFNGARRAIGLEPLPEDAPAPATTAAAPQPVAATAPPAPAAAAPAYLP